MSAKVAATRYLAKQQGLGDPTEHSLDSMGVAYDRSSKSENARNLRIRPPYCVASGSELRLRGAAQGTPLRQQAAAALVGLLGRSWVPLPMPNAFLSIIVTGGCCSIQGSTPRSCVQSLYQTSDRALVLPRIFRLHVSDTDRIDNVLAGAGIAAGDIRMAVISHLHLTTPGGSRRSHRPTYW